MSSGRKSNLLRAVGYLVSAVCLVVLAIRADWGAFTRYLANAAPAPLVAAAIFAMVTYIFFALRWRLLLNLASPPPLGRVFAILMAGYGANALFPLRAGDAMRVVLIHRNYACGIGRALSSIVLERVIDLLTLLMFGICIAFVAELPDAVIEILQACAVLAALLIVLIVVIAMNKGRAAMVVSKLTQKLSARVRDGLAAQVGQFAETVQSAFPRDRESLVRMAAVLGLSVLGWGSFGIAIVACTKAFGVQPAFTAGLLLMVITNLGSVIPASPGSLGVYHALGVLALSSWSVPFDLALSVATVSHVIAVGVQLGLGLCAMLVLRRTSLLKDSIRPPGISG